MNRFAVIIGIMTMFIVGTILSFSTEGEFGIAATNLTTTINSSGTTLVVDSTTGFLAADFVIIGEEQICYVGITATTFTNLTRGCNNTKASNHVSGSRVFNEGSGIVNSLIGFNIAEASSITTFSLCKIHHILSSLWSVHNWVGIYAYQYLYGGSENILIEVSGCVELEFV
jgi:hypothetical protein